MTHCHKAGSGPQVWHTVSTLWECTGTNHVPKI